MKLGLNLAFRAEGRRQLGFTLLELLASITVLGILLALGVPAFEQVIANARRSADVNELLSSMNLARGEALKRARHVTLCKSSDGANCGGAGVAWTDGWIVFVNQGAANANVRDAGEEILLIKDKTSRDSLLLPDAGMDANAIFRPDGRIVVSGGLTWCDAAGIADARGVFVNPAGRATSSYLRPDGTDLVCP